MLQNIEVFLNLILRKCNFQLFLISIAMDSYDNKYILIVQDNGVGFPPNLDFSNTNSVGLQLVNALTAQLNGEIELFNKEFTEFRITFPKKFQSK